MAFIYKICRGAEWDDARRAGIYAGSAGDRRDGFIHFSSAHQLMGTLAKYYAGANDLMLVAVQQDALGDALKFEPSRDGALFPHLYGVLPLSAVAWTKPVVLQADGQFMLPPECI
ncbi:MAG: DUF952 domain-containing protein [Alphaproteobacteria bacterium]|nr:DUF952 domain-containing protein [Alphaproteobacteria bacterium]